MKLGIFSTLLVVALSCEIATAQRTQPLQHIWEIQPDFGDVWRTAELPKTILFNVELLASPQTQERVQTAQLICREHRNPSFRDPSFQERRDRARELLFERLKSGEEPLQSKRAMISAAVLLGDVSHGPALWEFAQADSLMRTAVERALIEWKSPAALETWRSRLKDPASRPTDIALALEGLAVAGSAADNAVLTDVLRANQTSLANRYLAASTLGDLNSDGLNDLAQTVLDSDVEQRHLIAAHLIKTHRNDQTKTQMVAIYNEGSNAAQGLAAQSLAAHFPDTAGQLAPKWIEHTDAPIRKVALEWLQQFDDEASLRLQAKLMGDRDVELRRLVGKHLVEKAAQDKRAIVDECVTEYLTGTAWPGIEQALIVAVALDDVSRSSRMVELLEHSRPEVNMHAGWALMELAREPDIVASIVPHVEKLTARLAGLETSAPTVDSDLIRLSFLHEVFGKNLYASVEEMLLKYVPKNDYKMGHVSRASAIWALGQFNKDKDNPALRDSFCERIADIPPFKPEDQLVRFVCVLALGEMAYSDSIPTLKKFRVDPPAPLSYACDWALEQIAKSDLKAE